MAKNFYDITLALAGICQSAHLVQQLAYQGHCSPDVLKTMLHSLIDLNPSSTLSVFGNDESNLQFGLETLLMVLNSNSWQGLGAELTHYTLSMIMLERKLSASKKALRELAERIVYLDRQLAHYDLESDTLLSAMGGIYVDTISTLGPRIQVTGSPAVLQNALVQSKIRVTLLAGIRAAMLWRQVGGSRLQLMFSRSRLANEAKAIFARFSSEASSN